MARAIRELAEMRSGDLVVEVGDWFRRRLACWCQRGAKAIAPLVAARWRVTSTLGEVIATWRNKPGLGGLDLPLGLKEAVLMELAAWAEATFGDLERQVESEVAYVLHGAWLRSVI